MHALERKTRVPALMAAAALIGLLAACEPAKPDFTCTEGVGDLSRTADILPPGSC